MMPWKLKMLSSLFLIPNLYDMFRLKCLSVRKLSLYCMYRRGFSQLSTFRNVLNIPLQRVKSDIVQNCSDVYSERHQIVFGILNKSLLLWGYQLVPLPLDRSVQRRYQQLLLVRMFDLFHL